MGAGRPVHACLAVVERGGKILLVRRAKPPGIGKWGFPGGRLEPGETELQCAERELREELAIEADPVRVLTTFDYASFHLVAVLCRWRAGEGRLIEEASDFGWFALAEAETLDTFPDAVPAMRLAVAQNRGVGE